MLLLRHAGRATMMSRVESGSITAEVNLNAFVGSARRNSSVGLLHKAAMIAVAVLSVGATVAPLRAVTIAGTVQTTAGKPIIAAITIHDLSTARVVGQTPFDRQFASKVDGTFTLSGVPAGKYEFCVDAPQEKVLDPCIWTPTGAPTLTVTAASAIANYAITVDTGYMLQLRVNDPSAVLPASKSGVAGDALSLKLVTSANRVHNFRLLSSDSQGRNQYLIIPWNQTMTVVTESSSLTLKNAASVPLTNNSQRIPVHVPFGGTAAPITVNVAAATPTVTAKP